MARHHPGRHVLVLGSESLAASVAQSTRATHAASWLSAQGLGGQLEHAEQLGALRSARFDVVLCGIDINVSYAKLALACVSLEHGAALVAANTDQTFPFESGMTLPGNGSIVDLLSRVSGAAPEVLGKPGLAMLEQIEAETGLSRAGMLVIGDRFETDIEFAERAGIPSYMVLTGVTTDVAKAVERAAGLKKVRVQAGLAEVAEELELGPA
jgi:4-nitrophenyl phosphatase